MYTNLAKTLFIPGTKQHFEMGEWGNFLLKDTTGRRDRVQTTPDSQSPISSQTR